jgi:hypothetical protein
MPDAEKRKRADFVVDTSHGLDPVRAQISSFWPSANAPGSSLRFWSRSGDKAAGVWF